MAGTISLIAGPIQRALDRSTSASAGSLVRLSSGLRINSPADDAAGLAVATSLRADTRVYAQGVRNLNDGISALNIADSTLENLSLVATRISELAAQASNGTLGAQQRKSLDAEAQALAKEYFRIARSAKFNDINLFDGTLATLQLQGGYGSKGSVTSGLGGAVGDGTLKGEAGYITEPIASYAIRFSDLNRDGNTDMVTAGRGLGGGSITVRLGNGDGAFGAAVSFGMDATASSGLSLVDLNDDGMLDAVTAGTGGGQGSISIRLGNGDGSFRSSLSYISESTSSDAVACADLNGDGIFDVASAGTAGGSGSVTVRMGNGDGTFRTAQAYAAETTNSRAVSLLDLNNDGASDLVTAGVSGGSSAYFTARLGNGDGTFGSAVSSKIMDGGGRGLELGDFNNDNIPDAVSCGDLLAIGWYAVALGKGDGTFQPWTSFGQTGAVNSAVEAGDLNGDGNLDLVSAERPGTPAAGAVAVRLGNGDGTFRAGTQYQQAFENSNAVALADINNDGVPDLGSAGSKPLMFGTASVRLSNTRNGVAAILPFSLQYKADALQAASMLENTRELLSLQRSIVGAFQSRLTHAVATMAVSVENVSGARARIEEADIAVETSALIRSRIIEQTATGLIAHARQGMEMVLRLLFE